MIQPNACHPQVHLPAEGEGEVASMCTPNLDHQIKSWQKSYPPSLHLHQGTALLEHKTKKHL